MRKAGLMRIVSIRQELVNFKINVQIIEINYLYD
jgi:hypothetical protein